VCQLSDGTPLDVGFLVYNENTYPNLIGLFEVTTGGGGGGIRVLHAVCGALHPPHPHRHLSPPPPLSPPRQELRVPTEPSDMSFAVSLASRSFEWSSRGLNALFATRSNLVSPTFAGMLADLVRFSKCVPRGGGAVVKRASGRKGGGGGRRRRR
jgi:hypothetical protein